MRPTIVFLALPLAVHAASFTPQVSLLTDLPHFQSLGKTTIRSVLNTINNKKLKGTPFYFGSTLADPSVAPQNAVWTSARFKDTFNLAVAENNCKWFSNEPAQGVFNLTACSSLRDFAFQSGDAFRGHNTSDGVTLGMSLTECVLNASRWPNFAIDGNASSPVLFPDSSFLNTAFLNADKARKKIGSDLLLFYNDYNGFGGDFPSQAKTECAFKLLTELKNSGVPIDGIGIQSHYSANPQAFPSKASAHFTMDRLKNMGVMGAITELDVWLPDNSTKSLRWQASIFGDILDSCLYSTNCNEFTLWDPRDDESWLDSIVSDGVHMGTLFDASGNPKLPYFEVLARLTNFAQGGAEPCATSGGTSVCVL
ncbi:glycoside hydrolase superfamily [Mycena metata]|uniref:Beta-xylanase n=1 Tax=Mycena metata TaxID=1033252 RepID=A0AAD7IWN7_9AGAR|nr:glycoside hydrolase superfamily [Mycena metata]